MNQWTKSEKNWIDPFEFEKLFLEKKYFEEVTSNKEIRWFGGLDLA